MIGSELKNLIKTACINIGIEVGEIGLEHPTDLKLGDFSTNVAMVYGKSAGHAPKVLAEKIVFAIRSDIKNSKRSDLEEVIAEIQIANPGFINFHLTQKFFSNSVLEINKLGENFGRNRSLQGKKVMVEYTQPNPFKPFHIGHLVSNAIGESVSRLIEFSGAEILRANYQGDIGPHVAKAIYGILEKGGKYPAGTATEVASWIGDCYVFGADKHETDEKIKEEITKLNKTIYEGKDEKLNELYQKGREITLEAFEVIYKKLGTRFDYYFFESEMAPLGLDIVKEYLGRGVFERSEGAIIFPGEKHGLHNRVFVNSQGIPTYEAKELGLNKKKFELKNIDLSIVDTATEQKDYFRVVFRAIFDINKDWFNKTKHITHGMMRLSSGKMSSRKGNVVTGETLIKDTEELVFEKVKERDFEKDEAKRVVEEVAIGAIKYSILKNAPGGDIVYDFEKSISFEGDSGPYLQYSYVRANSILKKAIEAGIEVGDAVNINEINLLEKLLYRFPEIILHAEKNYSPNIVATYLIELAGAFNNFYANNRILEAGTETPYRLATVKAFTVTIKNSFFVLLI